MGPELTSRGIDPRIAAKLFTIAGPVIVYGIGASVVYGGNYWLCTIL